MKTKKIIIPAIPEWNRNEKHKIYIPKNEYHAIRISPGLHKELKAYCKLKGYNMSGYIEVAVKLRRMAEADAEKMAS